MVRSSNAPTGDVAEWLVSEATGGELAPKAQKGWDVKTSDGKRLQVKARFVSDPPTAGQRQLSAFRSFDFDYLIVVLLDDHRPVWRATKLSRAVVEQQAHPDDYVGARRVIARDALLELGEDWTERLQEICGPAVGRSIARPSTRWRSVREFPPHRLVQRRDSNRCHPRVAQAENLLMRPNQSGSLRWKPERAAGSAATRAAGTREHKRP